MNEGVGPMPTGPPPSFVSFPKNLACTAASVRRPGALMVALWTPG